MTTGQFDIVLGGHDADVTALNGGSIGSSGVRVIVDDTNCRKKEDAIQGINYILNRIKEGTWPPTIFSPLSLFAAGEQGAWYDPSDMTTLFQDDAGTVPVTATGQPVGRILDKSGRGNHATQSTAGSRPTFRDVNGLRFLEFDGVDDFLATGSVDFTVTNAVSVFGGARKLSDAAVGIIAEFSSSTMTNVGTFGFRAPRLSAETNIGWVINGGAETLTTTAGQVFPAPATFIASASATIGVSQIMRLNGAQQNSGTANAGSGNFGNFPIFIGRRNGATLPFSGNLYGLAIRGSLTNISVTASMEAYMANKAGVTLA